MYILIGTGIGLPIETLLRKTEIFRDFSRTLPRAVAKTIRIQILGFTTLLNIQISSPMNLFSK